MTDIFNSIETTIDLDIIQIKTGLHFCDLWYRVDYRLYNHKTGDYLNMRRDEDDHIIITIDYYNNEEKGEIMFEYDEPKEIYDFDKCSVSYKEINDIKELLYNPDTYKQIM